MRFPSVHSFSQIVKKDIPTIFRIFFRDLNILLHQPVALIIVLGIAFLPSLYAWVNIYANWDPYGRTGNLKVAVVSNDTGYREDGLDLNLGDSIIESLRANDAIGWQFVTEADARNGVHSGKYYAAVLIPESFSESVITFITDGSKRPAIEYYSNEKKNAIATKITNTGISTLQSTINEQFVNTISETLLDVLDLTDKAFDEKGKHIVAKVTASLEKADHDLTDFSKSVDLLIETGCAAQDLTTTAAALLPDLDTTLSDNISALENLRLLTQSAQNTAHAFTDVLDRNMSSISTSCETLYDNLTNVANDTHITADNAAETLHRMSATAESTANTVRQIRDFLSSNENKILSMAQKLENAKETLKYLLGHLPAPLADSNGSHTNAQSAIKSAIDNMISCLDSLYSDLNKISHDAETAAHTIQEAGALPADSLAMLRSDLDTLRSDLDAVKNDYQLTLSPLLDHTIDQFYVSLDSLSNLLLTTNQNLPLLGNVLTGVDSSLEHSIAALESSKTLIADAQKSIKTLMNDLNSVEKDARFAKLMDIIHDDPGAVADFVSSPVSIDAIQVYPIENYGSAMTPFYSILAIWVGGLLMCSILKTTVKEDEKIKNICPTVAYFGRFCLFALVGVIQAVIICLGDLYILKIQCLYPAQFILTGVVSALVYTLLMYTLAVSFKDVGKAIAVVIMVVQVAGSGGTFPAELLPSFFQTVNPYLPFTFSINAMRECIGGMYSNFFVLDLVRLSAIYVPISLLIGIVLRRPVIMLMQFFEHQVERTHLM